MPTVRHHASPRRARPVRRLACVAIAALVAVGCMSAGQEQVFSLVNTSRAQHGIPALRSHGVLNDKAQAWAEQLAREGRLRHSRLSEGAPGCWRRLGENVGYGNSIEQVHQSYLASPTHRGNILDRRFDAIGTGVARGGGRVYTVHVFMQSC